MESFNFNRSLEHHAGTHHTHQCTTGLYTKDEVVAIEKNLFRWPDEW